MINGGRIPRDFIGVGASAGGVEALIGLIGALPADLPGTVVVVIHRSPLFEGCLPTVLGRRARIQVLEAEHGARVERGRVYIAPRDHHLVVEGDRFLLDRGPKQHFTRPAIDPLFRTAAHVYGARVTGVILSGNGGDGVSGLIAIKAAKGISLVQDPGEAAYPSMPRSALRYDDVDAILPLARIPEVLLQLCRGEPAALAE